MQTERWLYVIATKDMRDGTPATDRKYCVALGCPDGSWWVDWPRASDVLTAGGDKLIDKIITTQLSLLLSARDNGLREVSYERAHELSRESVAPDDPRYGVLLQDREYGQSLDV